MEIFQDEDRRLIVHLDEFERLEGRLRLLPALLAFLGHAVRNAPGEHFAHGFDYAFIRRRRPDDGKRAFFFPGRNVEDGKPRPHQVGDVGLEFRDGRLLHIALRPPAIEI